MHYRQLLEIAVIDLLHKYMSINIAKYGTSLISLSIAVLFLVAYSFLSAQTWTNAPANPPSSNTVVIHRAQSAASSQWGYGTLLFDKLAATDSVNSDLYCDRNGENCFAGYEISSNKKCPTGQYLQGFATDGSLLCAEVKKAGSACIEESMFVQACQLMPSCPTGWTPAGPVTKGAGCEQGAKYNVQQCTRLVCEAGDPVQAIQSGSTSITSGSSVNVSFPTPYTTSPQVMVSIKAFNNIKPEYGYTSVGASVSATNITTAGFTITGTANGGGNLQVSWVAVGE